MTKRKIALMYEVFGKSEGLCKDCCHFQNISYHNRSYRKCEIYGITNSEASDWKGKQQACGAFNKDVKESNVIRMVNPDLTPDEWKAEREKMKAAGGYYSKFKHAFIFKTEEEAIEQWNMRTEVRYE